MEDLLKAVTTRKITKDDELSLRPLAQPTIAETHAIETPPPTTPESALNSLSSQPSPSSLYQTLLYLYKTTSVRQESGFNVLVPSAKAAQIIFVLVNDVLPSFWPVLGNATNSEEKRARRHLIRVLRSSSGFGALLAKLKADIEEAKDGGKGKVEGLQLIIEVFAELLEGDEILSGLYRDVTKYETRPQRADMWWKEICSVIASGRIVSLIAEGDALLEEASTNLRQKSWIADASQYSAWLGRNLRHVVDEPSEEAWSLSRRKAMALPLKRGLTLGHPGKSLTSKSLTLNNLDA